MREIIIPFPGFYETRLSYAIEHNEEMEAENLSEQYGLDVDEVAEIMFHNTDHQLVFRAMAKAYVLAYENYLLNEYGLNIKLEFSELVSPREYNFTTDRIFCKISAEDVSKLFKAIKAPDLAEVCNAHLKSRPGFMSFYDPDFKTWPALDEWDPNQLKMLLHAVHVGGEEAWEDGDIEDSLIEYLDSRGYMAHAIDAGVDWDEVYSQINARVADTEGVE